MVKGQETFRQVRRLPEVFRKTIVSCGGSCAIDLHRVAKGREKEKVVSFGGPRVNDTSSVQRRREKEEVVSCGSFIVNADVVWFFSSAFDV
jgi:hypothetical protein